jgi:hypothetical protein
MSRKKLSAGDTVEARCTRCRVVTNHTIVAMVGEQVVRVQCNTCGGVHNYKPPVTEKAPAAPKAAPKTPASPRRAAKDPAALERAEWEALRPTLQPERARPYAMDAAFKAGELVQHPVFGLGVVKSVGAGKAEMLFEEGKKLLRCR